MPRTTNPHQYRRPRTITAAFLLAALSLVSLVGLGVAQAQRGARNANNAAQQPPKPATKKRVFVSRGSDTGAGSRQTIKSDNPLNDYSAYRSGDRFHVVIPNADANAIPKGGGGRGYTDMQVQQRGKDVVLTYRLQPGAKPRVEQKFNRLDVVFETPEASTQAAANKPAQTTPTPAANDNRATNTQQTQATKRPAQTPTPTTSETAATRNPPTAAQTPNTSQAARQQQGGTVSPVVETPTGPPTLAAPATEVTPEAAPAGTPAEMQIAEVRQPGTTVPATQTSAPVTTVQPGTSLAAVLLRNWWVALSIALLVAGIGLFFVARRSSAMTHTPALEEDTNKSSKAALKKTPDAVGLKTAPTAASLKIAGAKPVADAPVVAAALAGVAATEESKEEEAKAEPLPFEKASQPVEETAVTETFVEEAGSVETPVEAPRATEVEEAGLSTDDATASAIEEASLIAAATPTSEIEPSVKSDAESVQVETKRLLEGERYDKGVLKGADMVGRQMVAAELLSALSGRNAERRARARAAFVEHGFFNEIAHDLHYSEAAAERAAAARSLALTGDHAATSHLVAALEDKSIEVRRAAVEGLAALRDPAAVEPLENLRERQKKHKDKLPRRLLQSAIETCREGSVEAPPVVVADAGAVADETPAVEPSVVATALVETSAVEATVSPADDAAPEVEAIQTAETEVAETEVAEAEVAELESPVAEAAPVEEYVEEPVSEPAPVEEVTEEIEPVEEITQEVEPVEAVTEEEITEEVAPVEEVTQEVAPALSEEVAEETVEEAAAPPVDEVAETSSVVAEAATTEEARVEVEAKEAEPVIEDAAAWFSMVSTEAATAVEESPVEETVVAEAPAVEIEQHAPEIEAPLFVEEHAETSPESQVSSTEITFEESVAPPVEADTITEEAERIEDETPTLLHDDAEIAFAGAATDWVEIDVEETPFPPVAETEESASFTAFDEETFTSEAPAELETPTLETSTVEEDRSVTPVETAEAGDSLVAEAPSAEEKGIARFDELSTVPKAIQQRIVSEDTSDRAAALADLSRLDTDDAFHQICAAFDDEARDVRSAAARALFDLKPDRADSFTRALREATPERRRHIGAAINTSGLAGEAVSQLTGESRERTYEAFSLLFLMAKAGEVQPLLRSIEAHPNSEVRLAVVKLLALSGQKEVLPAFRRLAVRGTLPTEVRSAIMEAIYQISSQDATSAA